jgi:hypothetical protein
MQIQVSSLLRTELNSLQNESDVNAVRVLANRLVKLQVQQDTKRDAEAGESITPRLARVDLINFMSQSVPSEMRISVIMISSFLIHAITHLYV